MFISQSMAKQFMGCRRKYFYSYVEKLESKHKGTALFLGSFVHEIIEMIYSNKFASFKELENKIEDEINYELLLTNDEEYIADLHIAKKLVSGIIKNYLEACMQYDVDNYEIIAVELPFKVPIKNGHHYVGMLDGLFRDKEGKYWVHEVKTYSSIGNNQISQLELDLQCTAYIYAAKKMGFDVQGLIYSMIKKAVPAEPKILKDGKPSKDKSQKTTYQLYLDKIKELCLDPQDYSEILDHLKYKGYRFIHREIVMRNDKELEEFETAISVIASEANTCNVWYKNPAEVWQGGCFCSYKSLCIEDTPEARLNFQTKEQLEYEGEAVFLHHRLKMYEDL